MTDYEKLKKTFDEIGINYIDHKEYKEIEITTDNNNLNTIYFCFSPSGKYNDKK